MALILLKLKTLFLDGGVSLSERSTRPLLMSISFQMHVYFLFVVHAMEFS